MSSPSYDAYGPTLFEAVITPHRSLSPVGLRILLGGIAALGGLIALRFWAIGAWPVIGFSVAEVGLAAFLLCLNHRAARAQELVLLHDDSLRVVRIAPSGATRERILPSAWMRVRLEEGPRRVSRLFVYTRSVSEEIGASLGEAEKRDLARALGSALYDAQHPRFDNPQLRQ